HHPAAARAVDLPWAVPTAGREPASKHPDDSDRGRTVTGSGRRTRRVPGTTRTHGHQQTRTQTCRPPYGGPPAPVAPTTRNGITPGACVARAPQSRQYRLVTTLFAAAT